MLRRFVQSQATVDEENPYWLSFSDLMSALLVVFILAAVALIIELTQTQKIIQRDIEELRNAEQARKQILYEIKDELASKNIKVEVADNDTVLRIPENTLTFDSGHDEIPEAEEVQRAVTAIGLALHLAINKPFSDTNNKMRFEYLDTVFIEGHTDSVPFKRIKGGNWRLSTDRAISLWKFWEKHLALTPSFNEMENAYKQKLFSVSGYAASRRVQTIEKTPEQRRRNRRIDLRFTVKRPSIAELEDIADR
ncbi:OmpA/MotB family protein [Desulfobacula toluolica]|uniref:Chemotaxis protein MotB-related protein n=1 Tax=Desulfobacula toluolica (strain DSM 7467 / Tol2) TaxID=651182 RepID=K0NP84_DESTT|nr:OmpA family protein [Desulfobacula toluolica]CCK80597.1 chemotaxis protein MotB-related protein [Desulfobacula toluolica Tol2]